MADKPVTETSTADAPLSAEELAAFEGDWNEGEEVPEKAFDANGKPKPASSGSDDDEAEDDATDETETEEETTDTDDSADEADDAEEETTEVETDEDSEEETTTTLTAEELKRHNDEMAKARIAERDARQVAKKAESDAQEATIERYLRDAGDDDIELERRQNNVEGFRLNEERISINEERLQTGIERAVASIPLFRTGSKAVQEELAASMDDFERMYVEKDDNGRPKKVNADVVQYLQAKAASIERLQTDGAQKQDKSKKKQQSRTTTPPTRAPKKAKEDPAMAGFKEEADRY